MSEKDYPTQSLKKIGTETYELMKKLYPICRSLTGNGVRESLKIIQEIIPIEIFEIPSGTKVFDWTIPKEWNVFDAYIKNSNGKKILDFKDSNLHILNYCIPVHLNLQLNELKKKLFTLPDYPNWIPYLTTYYDKNWGFCLTHNQYTTLEDDTYEVVINSSLEDGYLTYGELLIKGEKKDEFLLSTYICHPSLCNDNLSGPVILTYLAKHLLEVKEKEGLKYSYRFLFIPETIGAITWLHKNEKMVSDIKFGLVATCLGDSGKFNYKRSRIGSALIDQIVEKVLLDSHDPFEIIDFFPSGSDERQFCSPGFNMPIGSLMRTVYAHFPEYHTSADNLDFVKAENLAESYYKYLDIIYFVEKNYTYKNLNPNCEPQLGKRVLYDKIGGLKDVPTDIMAISWVLNLSDGKNSILDIANRSKLPFKKIIFAAKILEKEHLLTILKD